MKKNFQVRFLEEAIRFLKELDEKTKSKILTDISKAERLKDPELFKKLRNEIWEFRTRFNKKQYRILAFWDKRDKQEILVIATHGFIKKTMAVPDKEIQKAEKIRKIYFED